MPSDSGKRRVASVASRCSRRFRAVWASLPASFGNQSETSPFAMLLLLWCLAFAWAFKDSSLLLVCATAYLYIKLRTAAMRRTTACSDFTFILRTTAYNFQVKSSNLIRPRPRPKRSGPLTLQGPWVRSARKGPVLTPGPQLCCSASVPAQLYPHNCVDNFPASRLTTTFVWNVKTQTSEFCASVSDTIYMGSDVHCLIR